MKGVNKVILIGDAGKDPEYKTLQDGTPVAKLTIATTETYRLKNGETQSRTDWHSIILCGAWSLLPINIYTKEACST
jgi:single-strand DNA-binding protein